MSQSTAPLSGRTVLFLVSEDWYFWSHRRVLARAAREAGARVVVAARMTEHREGIWGEGFEPVHIPFDRSGVDPRRDLATLAEIIRAYRRHKPDLVHHVAMKPVLYGSIAAKLTRVPAVVNAVAGLGFLFISSGVKARTIRTGLKPLLQAVHRSSHARLVVQNEDDRAIFLKAGIRRESTAVIRGSGVDVEAFRPAPEPDGTPVAVCVSRMLWDKGIGELVEAARLLRNRRVALRVRLVGPTDANPSSIPESQLRAWAGEGLVEIAGPTRDVANEYARAHIAVLPSYREGLPKSLLEAAACGRPLVATDVPGCREVCRDGETGLLVPARSATDLADALQRLVEQPGFRRALGAGARRVAELEFAESIVAQATMDLYADLLRALPAVPDQAALERL
jgi:glycosyltransferase involved in cell wall biosynthesis